MGGLSVNCRSRGRLTLRRRSILSLAGAVCAASGAGSSLAQDTDGVETRRLEEVVVTATRRTEMLQDVPVSVAVVSADDLDRRGINGLQQLSQSVSGLTLSQPESGISAGVYIRGVGTMGNSPADQSVGVVVDGVYQLRSGAAFTEMLDVDRIEVLRGPQGTLFGKNTTAGVVAIHTADPDTQEFSGRVQGVAGNLDAREARGYVNIPLIDNKLAARISTFSAQRDGFTENVFLNEDTRNIDRQGWRAKLLWNVTDTFQAKLSVEHNEQESNMDSGLVEYGAIYDGFDLPPIGIGRYQQQHSEVFDDVERYVMKLSWDIYNHTLSTITAYEEVELGLVNDYDETVLNGELGPTTPTILANTALTKSTTQEVQLASNFDGAFNYIAGLYYQNEDVTSDTTVYLPVAAISRPPSVRDTDSKAVFGTAFYDFSDQWRASLGLRYTEDERQGTNSQFDGVTQFDQTTWSAKLMWDFAYSKMAYVAFDKGFKSGGVNREFTVCGSYPGAPCLTPDQAMWDPETTLNYEIGLKSEWMDNRLRLNAAAFYQTYDDFQVTQDYQQLSTVVVANAAEVESYGLETDLTFLATDLLTLNGSATWVNSEYSSYPGAFCGYPDQAGCVDGLQDLTGETLDHAPELSFNLGAELRDSLSLLSGGEWFTRVDVVYRGDQNLYVSQPPETEQDAYALWSLRAGVELYNGFGFTLWGDNITDKEYVTEATVGQTGLTRAPGLERTYGVTVDYRF